MNIYKKYDQAQLDLQYNNRFHVPDFQKHLDRWEELSRIAENRLKVIKDIAYGSGFREAVDIFSSEKPNSKTLVFIHGGYWYKFDKTSFHFIARAFAGYNITSVIINYPLVPTVTIDKTSEACRKAINWISKNIYQWNGNPEEIYIVGHSAGAHLATSVMMNTQENENVIRGVCAISGLYNLLPIYLSNVNDILGMDKETALRNSPALKDPIEYNQLLLAVGSEETDEFISQSKEYYTVLKNKSSRVEFLEISGMNHFSILSSLTDQESIMHKSICNMMSLK